MPYQTWTTGGEADFAPLSQLHPEQPILLADMKT